jgi:hypothetical protein
MNNIKIAFILLLTILLGACDKGLAPEEENLPAVLIGKVRFINEWPPEDSVFAIRAGAFKSPPSADLINEVLNGNAYFNLSSLGYNLDSAEFMFTIEDTPVELKYIVIVWQYESDIAAERVVGVYNIANDKTIPGSITLKSGDTSKIEIEVDWNDFPPQPF